MLLEKDLNLLRDELMYINSKGKQVKRKPRKILGGIYYLEAAYENLSFGTCTYITYSEVKNKKLIQEFRSVLMQRVLKELTP